MRQSERNGKRQNIDNDKAYDGKQSGIPERTDKALVGKCSAVVIHTYECSLGNYFELTEGQIYALNERPYKADSERRGDREQEQPEPLAQRSAKRIGTAGIKKTAFSCDGGRCCCTFHEMLRYIIISHFALRLGCLAFLWHGIIIEISIRQEIISLGLIATAQILFELC